MNIYDLHSLAWSQLDARRAQLPHALLISGQRGLGKFELARRFAESLLCEQPTIAGDSNQSGRSDESIDGKFSS